MGKTIEQIHTADGLQDAAEFEKKHYSSCRKVYEKYQHLDTLFEMIDSESSGLQVACADMWRAIKNTIKESKC